MAIVIKNPNNEIGKIKAFPFNNLSIIPSNYLICGYNTNVPPGPRTVSKTDYPRLYKKLCDGGATCIYGEDTTTFTLPNYTGKFLRAWNSFSTISITDDILLTISKSGNNCTYTISGNNQLFNIGQLITINCTTGYTWHSGDNGTFVVTVGGTGNFTVVNSSGTNSDTSTSGTVLFYGVDPEYITRGPRGDSTPGNVVGTIQDDTMQEHYHTYFKYDNNVEIHGGTPWTDASDSGGSVLSGYASNTNKSSYENRPLNISVVYAIRVY